MGLPYTNVDQLPGGLQKTLPAHALHIYINAYNSAWQTYADSRKREEGSREEVAHKVAWASVKRKYRKNGNIWQRKELVSHATK